MYRYRNGTHYIKDGLQMKKYICLLLALTICFTFFGCSRSEEEAPEEETTTEVYTEPVYEENITLGYYEDKSLNPYTTDRK